MIKHARTAVKFFVYGLIVGLLFSPASGEANRKRLIEWASGTIRSVTE